MREVLRRSASGRAPKRRPRGMIRFAASQSGAAAAEFVLVLPETPLNHAHYVAEKLRGEIEGKGFCYNKRRVPITVSIGIAQFADLESVDVVFQRADRALYAAKNASRNRCVTETGLEGEAP